TFDNDIELLEATDRQTTADFIQGDMFLGTKALLTLYLLSGVGNLSRFTLSIVYLDRITCLRCTTKSQHLNGRGWSCFFELLACVIKHCFHAAIVLTG